MHWKHKAALQNAVSLLPSSVSYTAIYWIQRYFGGLRRINPVNRLNAGIEPVKRIKELGYDPSGKVFLEVGTGRVPLVPLAYWLMGSKRTITIDINLYLRSDLIKESLRYILNNNEEIRTLFGSLMDGNRMEDLLHFIRTTSFSSSAFLDLCGITYKAPGDAANTTLDPQSVNFHTSCTVYEHIPLEILRKIIGEGNRIITKNGLFINRIDYGDHFSHSDKMISPINFFQFTDGEWERYAGNKYMYMNRLRHDDYIRLFLSEGHRILAAAPDVDHRLKDLIRGGKLRLAEQFQSKSEDVLSTTGAWIVSQKSD